MDSNNSMRAKTKPPARTSVLSKPVARGMAERVHHQRFKIRADAIQAITEYIEIFYRRQRKQARLGYLSLAVFERQFYEKKLAAWIR